MVANGVTTVRFMIGTPELLSLRSRSATGEIEAPTIFVAARPDWPRTREQLRRQHAGRGTRGRAQIEGGWLRLHQSDDVHQAGGLRSGSGRSGTTEHPRGRSRRQPFRRRRTCMESETADRAPRRVHGTTASRRRADERSVSDFTFTIRRTGKASTTSTRARSRRSRAKPSQPTRTSIPRSIL